LCDKTNAGVLSDLKHAPGFPARAGDDFLEVEFFKTNSVVADSDGDGYNDDGYNDDDQLFARNRYRRVAYLPEHAVQVGSVHLLIYERFTFTDENGTTCSESSSTGATLATSNGMTRLQTESTTRSLRGGAEFGLEHLSG
jgi:hypothetical protein